MGDDELTWDNTTRIPGDEAVAGVRKLHETENDDLLVMGSPTLVRTLLHEGLVDELRLMRMPVILGGGKTIFPDDGMQRPLELVSTVTSGTGVHVCTYRPVADGSAGRAGSNSVCDKPRFKRRAPTALPMRSVRRASAYPSRSSALLHRSWAICLQRSEMYRTICMGETSVRRSATSLTARFQMADRSAAPLPRRELCAA